MDYVKCLLNLPQTKEHHIHNSLDFYFGAMNQQPGGGNANPGNSGGAYIPPPRQDMEYICAGMNHNPV